MPKKINQCSVPQGENYDIQMEMFCLLPDGAVYRGSASSGLNILDLTVSLSWSCRPLPREPIRKIVAWVVPGQTVEGIPVLQTQTPRQIKPKFAGFHHAFVQVTTKEHFKRAPSSHNFFPISEPSSPTRRWNVVKTTGTHA